MNLFITVLICFANPVIAYVIVKFLGLEQGSLEYYFFDDPQLPFFTILISVEYVTMKIIKSFPVAALTPGLLILIWVQICLHLSAFILLSFQASVDHHMYTFYIDEYVSGLYPAILALSHCGQLYLLIVALGTGQGFGNSRRNS